MIGWVVLTLMGGGDNVGRLLAAAEREVTLRVAYDMSQRYRILTFRRGIDTKRSVYPNGDLSGREGVCTDLIVRAYRGAGIDFQRLIHEDIKRAPAAYPLKTWRQRRPDRHIDHRRVPNLLAYLRRHAKVVAADQDLAAGDIVVWDMASRGWPDHIGLVSSRRSPDGKRPLMIHSFPDPGYTAYADVLTRWRVVERLRVLAVRPVPPAPRRDAGADQVGAP